MDRKKIYILISVVLAVFLILFSMRGRINLSLNYLVNKVDFKNDTVFKNFSITDTKVNGEYAVQFRDIVAGTGDIEKRYFRVDMTITVSGKNGQKMIVKNDALAAAVIASTLSNFKVSDVSTVRGKEFLKKTIKKNLENKFGDNLVKDVYFEKFIYN
ncbi:MAG: hypothetical protein PWQ25_679 [Deferribacteres bacterium]|jgi:flagellar basal body-associated protein FliL|nr:hypothetical protein [Deferribacteres bacterium]